MEYTTQMDAARKGIATPQMKIVAEKERMPLEKLMELVAKGQVAICANKAHTCLDPQGVGSMLRTKINVNLGVSRDCKDYDIEMKKVQSAIDLGAEAIMDLSSHGDTQPFRKKLVAECPAMIGTVPVYDSVIHYQRDLGTLTAQDFIDVVRLHAEDGVDFVTLHCGITRKTIDQIRRHKRKMNIVPVLCHPGGAPSPAQRGGRKAGHHRLENRRPRRGHRQGHPRRPGDRRQDGQRPPCPGLGSPVRLRPGPRDRPGHPGQSQARGRPQRHLQHVRQVLRRAQHEQGPERGVHRHSVTRAFTLKQEPAALSLL